MRNFNEVLNSGFVFRLISLIMDNDFSYAIQLSLRRHWQLTHRKDKQTFKFAILPFNLRLARTITNCTEQITVGTSTP